MQNSVLILFFSAIISFGLFGRPAVAETASAAPSCKPALTTLLNDWSAIGFATPYKPGQAVIEGKGGHITTGWDFNFMEAQIYRARAECERGDAVLAIRHITAVRDLLDRASHPMS